MILIPRAGITQIRFCGSVAATTLSAHRTRELPWPCQATTWHCCCRAQVSRLASRAMDAVKSGRAELTPREREGDANCHGYQAEDGSHQGIPGKELEDERCQEHETCGTLEEQRETKLSSGRVVNCHARRYREVAKVSGRQSEFMQDWHGRALYLLEASQDDARVTPRAGKDGSVAAAQIAAASTRSSFE